MKTFTKAEVAMHNCEHDAWLILDGKVFDITPFLDEHPGGRDALMEYLGGDGTEGFEDMGHSKDARAMTQQYLIGELSDGAAPVQEAPKRRFRLVEKRNVSHNTRKFRFALANDKEFELPIGQHIFLHALINGEAITRPYTPVSDKDQHPYVDFVIKVYPEKVNPKFPQGGQMSQHLDSLTIGGEIEFRGPSGRIRYHGAGKFIVNSESSPLEKRFKRVGMIAGGTGITPMLQVIKSVLKNENDETELSLLFANTTVDDILCRDELEELQRWHRRRFRVWYTVSQPEESWPYSVGHVDELMIESRLPQPDEDTGILLCGPPGLISGALMPALDKLNYAPENRIVF